MYRFSLRLASFSTLSRIVSDKKFAIERVLWLYACRVNAIRVYSRIAQGISSERSSRDETLELLEVTEVAVLQKTLPGVKTSSIALKAF